MSVPAASLTDHAAERELCGSLATYEPALALARGTGLLPEHFAYRSLGAIYAAALSLDSGATPLDSITLTAELERQGTQEAADGAKVLPELAEAVAAPGNAEYHSKRILETAERRRIHEFAEQVGKSAAANTLNGDAGRLIEIVNNSASGRLELTKGSDIPLRSVSFLDAAEMIPTGSVTVIVGTAGLGKTTYSLATCAAASTGKLAGVEGPRNVLISSQEDDDQAVLMPRFKAAAGDMERVYTVKGLTIPAEIDALHAHASELDAAIVLIDPIAAHLDSGVDSHRDAAIRGAIAPLADMAADLDLAVIVVAHPNKAASMSGLARISGSSGLGNAARSVIVFGADPADPEGDAGSRRIIAHLKCNVGKRAPSLTAEVEIAEVETEDGKTKVPRLKITGTSDHDAEDVLGSPNREERTERDDAQSFLEQVLSDGPVRTKEIRNRAEDAELSWRTVERAKKDLSVQAIQGPDGWYWQAKEDAR